MAKKKQIKAEEINETPKDTVDLDTDLLGEESPEKKLIGYHPITGEEIYI